MPAGRARGGRRRHLLVVGVLPARGGQALLLRQLLQHGSLLVLVRQLRLQLLSGGIATLPPSSRSWLFVNQRLDSSAIDSAA